MQKMQSAQIISCSKLITLHLLQSRQPLGCYTPHKGIVNSIHINHTNKVIASAGQDGCIVLVNAQKPDNVVFQTNFHNSTSILASKSVSVNSVMFSSHSHYIAAGSSDCLVKIWDMKNHKHVFSTIKSHVGSVNSLGWIKNSGVQSFQGQILVSGSSVGDIFLHSVKTSNILETLNTKNQQSINQLKISQTEGFCRLAACTNTGSLMVWDIKNIEKTTNPQSQFYNDKKSSITSLSFSSFNPVLLAASSLDQTLTFYDIKQKKSVKKIPSQQPLTSVNFHSDGHTLVAGGNYGGLFVYDLRKPNKPRQKLIGHQSAIKQTFLIKQYQPSNMSISRASKTSSVNSYNSSKVSSQKDIKEEVQEKKQIKEVKLNNFVQPNTRSQATGFRTESIKAPKNQSIQTKKQNIMLSTTTQQILKNKQIKTGVNKQIPPPTTTNGPYNYYNKPTQNTVTSSSYSKPNLQSGSKFTNSQVDNNILVSPDYQQHRVSPNTVNNSTGSVNRHIQGGSVSQIKDFIQQKFETLHMQLIHQFHMQQKDMKDMIINLLIQDKKKTQKIKQLELQIKRLRQNAY